MGSVAVCCGFNQYGHATPLVRAVNDAVHPYAELTRNLAFNAEPHLLGISELFTQPTTSAGDILAAFARAARSGAELVWFSFAGHAVVSTAGELRLLLPQWHEDASEDDRRRWSIGARDLEDAMRPHLAGTRFVVVLDACFSGAFGGDAGTRDLAVSGEGRIASAGAVVISACGRDQRASDGAADRARPNGVFTAALIQVLRERAQTGASLSVFELFLETKRKIVNGQQPTLFASGLTDDFTVLADARSAEPSSIAVARMSLEVPRKIECELTSFLRSVVRICRSGGVGLVHAKRQLQRLAGEFHQYANTAFVVSGTNANVVEAFETARACVIGCTTPPYFDEWRRSGIALLTANKRFIQQRGGRVVRFFFVQDDIQSHSPGVVNVIRDHVKAGVRALIVHVDSFGAAVMQEVFNHPSTRDLSSLECAFVDGRIFLKTHFIVNGHADIEIDQGPTRCQHEYKAKLQPFLGANHGRFFAARLDAEAGDQLAFDLLGKAEVEQLQRQLEHDLGVTTDDATPIRLPRYGG